MTLPAVSLFERPRTPSASPPIRALAYPFERGARMWHAPKDRTYAAFLRAEGRKKGELTLDDDEFRALLQFIADNYEPFRAGAKRYISIVDRSNREMLNTYASFFAIRTSNS
jgi:hypothetical protein